MSSPSEPVPGPRPLVERLALAVPALALAVAWGALRLPAGAVPAWVPAAEAQTPAAPRTVAPHATPNSAPNGSPYVAPAGVLRVCADPNNLPFSDSAGRGFENRIARVLAADLGDSLAYTWWAQRRGFVRNTLKARRCDVVVGAPVGDDQMKTTAPYYRSTYVFVTRRGALAPVHSFDDPRLRRLRVGVHVIGADGNSLPPGVALAHRGIITNVRGYSIYGDYREESPPSRLVQAVARGEVDVAVAWGPLAGYYARRSRVPLVVTPVDPSPADGPAARMVFGMALGVRRGDDSLRTALEGAMARRRGAVQRILADYGVPLVDAPAAGADVASRETR